MTREEEVQSFAAPVLMIKLSIDKYGLEKMKPAIAKWMEGTATQLWKAKMEQFGIQKGGSPLDMFKCIRGWGKESGIFQEMLEEQEDRVRYRIRSCQIYDACKSVGLDPRDFCENGIFLSMDAVPQFINPNIKWTAVYNDDREEGCHYELCYK